MARVAYRVTRSRKRFTNYKRIQDYMKSWMEQDVKPHFLERFEIVVMNWQTRVEFAARKYFDSNALRLTVHPTVGKEIWGYVSQGTRPHVIVPKGPWPLQFKTGYKPKTLPPAKFGGPGIATGPMVAAWKVQHPGSEGREFEKNIMEDEKPWFRRNAENAWRRAIRTL